MFIHGPVLFVITTDRDTSKENSPIVLPRSNDHVYICLFVNIEIKTSGWHIQQSNVVLKTIRYQLVRLSR